MTSITITVPLQITVDNVKSGDVKKASMEAFHRVQDTIKLGYDIHMNGLGDIQSIDNWELN